ncbi:MAG: hypothetical protein K9K81_10480 [Desulfobacteraceae bacterium]|nr:hypothetical protein [Desulfobacteraceae bacterium]
MISTRMFTEWLDARFPDWFALAAGMLLGAFGVMALGFLVLCFTPAALAAWMPVIAAFCGVSAGYKYREKSQSESPAARKILCPVSGLGPAAAGIIIQTAVNRRFFGAETSTELMALIVGLGIGGAFAGGLLRSRYEKIGEQI